MPIPSVTTPLDASRETPRWFSLEPSPLGPMMIVSSPQGVCRISWGDPDELSPPPSRGVSDRSVESNRTALEQHQRWAEAVRQRIRDPWHPQEVPLDLQGTDFQQRVWQRLLEIPCGQRLTYAQLAVEIGQPAAVRAVANACGANPVPVLVPCHRIVASGGGLGGFSAGLPRKVRLLAAEDPQQRLFAGDLDSDR